MQHLILHSPEQATAVAIPVVCLTLLSLFTKSVLISLTLMSPSQEVISWTSFIAGILAIVISATTITGWIIKWYKNKK